jgi:hypothetical protein
VGCDIVQSGVVDTSVSAERAAYFYMVEEGMLEAADSYLTLVAFRRFYGIISQNTVILIFIILF